ncbi:hypothetical protein RB600_002956 [Gaeumannomyces tritici]
MSGPWTSMISRSWLSFMFGLVNARYSYLEPPRLEMHLFCFLLVGFVSVLAFDDPPLRETRSIDEIYRAALDEGGTVTLWHGGDEVYQRDNLKAAFEARFPGVTVNLTVDLSKYLDGRFDDQLARAAKGDAGAVTVDSIILQTVHDYPRWAQQRALLDYRPLGWDQISPAFRDQASATHYGVAVFSWPLVWSTDKLPAGTALSEFDDFLRPELKDKIVLTMPHDDDAVLWAFDLIIQQKGTPWLDALLAQNPRWVRGTHTPLALISRNDTRLAATFTSGTAYPPPRGLAAAVPRRTRFVSWPQTAAIPRAAPHPEAARLLLAFLLSTAWQGRGGWSVRGDVTPPPGTTFGVGHDVAAGGVPSTDPAAFAPWMADRARVERLRLWFEDRLGTPQGPSPLVDGS